MKYVTYAKQRTLETNAQGVTGVLCKTIEDGQTSFFFRVRQENGEFKDYQLRHDDMQITIALEELASFYQLENGRLVLDHSSEVLGLNAAKQDTD